MKRRILACVTALTIKMAALGTELEVPYYWQDGAGWCGLSSAAMVARYHNPPKVGSAYLKPWWAADYLDFPKSTDGASFSDIIGVLSVMDPTRHYNWNFGYTLSNALMKSKIREVLDSGHPLILHGVDFDGYKHVIVIVGADSSTVTINDPSGIAFATSDPYTGMARNVRVTVTWDEFFSVTDSSLAVDGTLIWSDDLGSLTESRPVSMDVCPVGALSQTEGVFNPGFVAGADLENGILLNWDGQVNRPGYYYAKIGDAGATRPFAGVNYPAYGYKVMSSDTIFLLPFLTCNRDSQQTVKIRATVKNAGVSVASSLSDAITLGACSHHYDDVAIAIPVSDFYLQLTQEDCQIDIACEDASSGTTLDSLTLGFKVDRTQPVLWDGNVSPTSGGTGTGYTFSVKYRDPTGGDRQWVRVYVDGVARPDLTLQSGSYSDGTFYTYPAITLGSGTHNYYFTARSAGGQDLRFPASGTLPGPVVSASGSSVTLTAVADAEVREESPNTNYGLVDMMGVAGDAGAQQRVALRFDVSGIPSGSTIDSVELKMDSLVCNNPNNVWTYLVALGVSWSETGVTWNNKPTATGGLSANQRFTSTGYHYWRSSAIPDLKTTVQGWVNGTKPNYGLMVENEPGTASSIWYYTRHRSSSEERPKLIVDYTPPPTGSLTVYIDPADARNQGAQWKLTSGPDTSYHDSGETIVDLPTGSYTLYFSSVSGWSRPASHNTSITVVTGLNSRTDTYGFNVSAPTGVSASDEEFSDKVRIQWNASDGATQYEVWRATANSSGSAARVAGYVTGTSWDDYSVSAGPKFYYWVKAKNSAGTTGFSSSNSGCRSAPPTVAVTGPTSGATWSTAVRQVLVQGTASDEGTGVTRVDWTNAATGESGTVSGTTSWYIVVPLASGANAITVTATDGIGLTASDSITVTYTPTTGMVNVLMNPGFEERTPPSMAPWAGGGTVVLASDVGVTAAEGQNIVMRDWDSDTNTWQTALDQTVTIGADDIGKFWTARVKGYLPSSVPSSGGANSQTRLIVQARDSSGAVQATYQAWLNPSLLDAWQDLDLFGVISALDVGGSYRFQVQGGYEWTGRTYFDDASFAIGLIGSSQAKWTGQGTSDSWAQSGNWEGNRVPGSGDDVYIGTGFASGTNVSLGGNRTVNSLTIDPGSDMRLLQIGADTGPGTGTVTVTSGRLTRVRSANTNLFRIYPNIDFGTPPGGRAILDAGHAGPTVSPNSFIHLYGQVRAVGDVMFLSRQSATSSDVVGWWHLRGRGDWTGATLLGEDSIGGRILAYGSNSIPANSRIEGRNSAGISGVQFNSMTNVFPNEIRFGVDSATSGSADFRIIAEVYASVTLTGLVQKVGTGPWRYLGLFAGDGSTLTLSNANSDVTGIAAIQAGWWNTPSGTVLLQHENAVRGAPEVRVVARGTKWLLGGAFVFSQPFNVALPSGLSNAMTVVTLGGAHASGTAVFSGSQNWEHPTAEGATLRLHCENAGTVTRFSGDITDGAYSINVEKTGAGEVVLSGNNTWSGPTTLKSGRLTLDSAGAFPALSALVFAGGELHLNGRSAAPASVAVGATATVDFGAGAGANALSFASGSAGPWAGTLTVTNFEASADSLRFGTSSSGAGGNEGQIRFVNPAGLPPGTYTARIDANGYVVPGDRLIQFAGMEWVVASGQADPGNNQWSEATESVWVDDSGLHLKVRNVGGTWRCAGVTSLGATKEGLHRFWLSSRVDQLDRNVVASIGLRKDASKSLDMDFSRWGNASGPNARYAVQPAPLVEGSNLRTLNLGLTAPESTHYIDWGGGQARFKSFRGHAGDIAGAVDPRHIDDWTCAATTVPVGADGLRICLQLWLAGGAPPSDGQEAELVIRAAEFPPGVAALGQKANALGNPSFEDAAPPAKTPWSGGGSSAVASDMNLDGGAIDGIAARDGTRVLHIDHDGSSDSFYQYYWFKPEDVGKGWRASLAAQIPATDPPTNAWTVGHQPRMNLWWTEPTGTSVITGYAYFNPGQSGVWQTAELSGIVAAADVGRRLEFKGYAVGSTYTGSALYDDAHFDVGSAFGQSTFTWTPSAGSGAWSDEARWSSGRVPGILDDAIIVAGPEPRTTVNVDGEQIMYSLALDNSGTTGAVSVGSAPHAGKLHVISGRVVTPLSSNRSTFAINSDIDFGRPQGGVAVFDAWRAGAPGAAGDVLLNVYGDIAGECDVKFLVTQSGFGDVRWYLRGTGTWSGKTVLGDAANGSRVFVVSPAAIPPSSTIECAGQRSIVLAFMTNTTVPNDILVPRGNTESASRTVSLRAVGGVTLNLAGRIMTQGPSSQGWLGLVADGAGSKLTLNNTANAFDGLGGIITGVGTLGTGERGRVVLAKAGVFNGAPDIYFQIYGGSWLLGEAFDVPQKLFAHSNARTNSMIVRVGGIHALGTAEFSGAQFWTNASANGATLQLYTENAGAVTRFSGDITDGAQSINVEKTGAGEVVLAGSNSWSGPMTISNGVLTVASASAMPTISPLAVGAGTLQMAGLSVTVASLDVVSDAAALDFGAGAGANHFVATAGAAGAWSGRLAIGHFDPSSDTMRLGSADADAGGNGDRITFVSPDGMAAGNYAAVVQPDGFVTVGALIPVNPDADGDGMPDDWEIAHFGSIAALPGDDFDRDGFTNLQERWAGTNPTVWSSRPRVGEVRGQGHDMIIRFDSVLGRRYRVESSDDLRNWTRVVQDNVIGTGDPIDVPDPGGRDAIRRFYRVIVTME